MEAMETTEMTGTVTSGTDPAAAAVQTQQLENGAVAIENTLDNKLRLIRPDTDWAFNPDDLMADPARNARFSARSINDPDIIELAASIAAEGQLQPGRVLVGVDDHLYIIFGAGRYLAIQRINADRTPAERLQFRAYVSFEGDNLNETWIDNFVLSVQENAKRKELTALDNVHNVGVLLAKGMKQADIARRLGMKRPIVTLYARVSRQTDQVKQLIAEGKISATAVDELAQRHTAPGDVERDVLALIAGTDGKKVSVSKAREARSVNADQESDTEVSQDVESDQQYSRKKVVKSGSDRTNKVAPGTGDGKDKAGIGKKLAKGASKAKVAGRHQRTAKQISDFLKEHATVEVAKQYGDKKLVDKLRAFTAFVAGGRGETFLTNLAGL